MQTSSYVWKYVALNMVWSHKGKCGNGEYQSLYVRAQSINVERRKLDNAWGSDCKILFHLTNSITKAGESVQRRQCVTRANERHKRKWGNGEYQSLCVIAQSIIVGRRELDNARGSDCKMLFHLTDSITRAGESVQRRQCVMRANERHGRKCGGRLQTLSACLLLKTYQGYWEGDASLEVFSTKINK